MDSKENKTIDIYAAIARMKELSAAGETFSFKFRKWNRRSMRGGDMCSIAHARLRPKASDEQVDAASYKLFFTDTDTGRAMVCWQPLIIEFEGERTILP